MVLGIASHGQVIPEGSQQQNKEDRGEGSEGAGGRNQEFLQEGTIRTQGGRVHQMGGD